MANLNLKFFNKRGQPLNLIYVGPTGSSQLDTIFRYSANSTTSLPTNGTFSLLDLSTGSIYLSVTDLSGYNITSWVSSVQESLTSGAKVNLTLSYAPAQTLLCTLSAASLAGSIVTLTVAQTIGSPFISSGTPVTFTTTYQNLPGGYFSGNVYFDEISAGLYENEQIFVVQEFYDPSTNQPFLGFPHTGATGSASNPLWRTRWENNTYGNVDVTEIIFTYQIVDNDPEIGGSPSILNYQNIVIPVIKDSQDYLVNGLVYTDENSTPSRALQVNVAINSGNLAANVYERKLIIEDITYGITAPQKIAEILFYGQIIAEDSRLDVLTQNLGRAFFGSDSVILRDHDPFEILPNYVEINEKRKELMVAGEDIFPYIGSYRGLIGALKFFGYQDLRIKEYWLNLNYGQVSLQPLQQNQIFLNNNYVTPFPNQQSLIADVLENENSGKYRLVQTWGPNEDGEYVLDVASEATLVPSRTYKKTSLFGLYYDLVTTTDQVDPYGYPIVQETFLFTQEEVLLKLFALKERLKQSYLPLNARIVDITGEGVYYNVYNTREWTDFMDRTDVESGNNFDFIVNPDFGFLEDLRAFGVRENPAGIQAPANYEDVIDIEVYVVGGTGDSFRFVAAAGTPTSLFSASGFNPNLTLFEGKSYNFNLVTSGFDFFITTDSGLTEVDPLGVVNNGAVGGPLTLKVNPQEQNTLYYFSSVNTARLNGSISIQPDSVSDLGNIIPPLVNNQQYTSSQNTSLLTAISNFYFLKENGKVVQLGDGLTDPVSYLNPTTGEPYENPLGMPLILELVVDRWVWDEMGQNWNDLSLPSYTSQQAALTWGTIDFSAYNEVEWIIQKSSTQSGSGYSFSFRGFVADYYKLAHFVPYTGEYEVTCLLYDAFNFVNRRIVKTALTVAPKEITIDAWTRYRENEIYLWDQTIRSWDAYQSIWEYPAEGQTYDELTREIPAAVLDFAVYGNNANQGQNLQVQATIPAVGASGSFVLNQNIIPVSAAYSLYISGSQYGFMNIFTSQPHGFQAGSQVYLAGFMPELNYSWDVIIPSGSTGYNFQIPYILGATSGVGLTGGTGSVSGATAYYVDPSYWTNQRVTGQSEISVTVNGREIGATSGGSNLQATVSALIETINSVVTQPDYFAQCPAPDASPAQITITSDVDSGNIGNGDILSVSVNGSLILVSSDSQLTGGATASTDYVSWDPLSGQFPVEALKYYGTKNLTWDTFNQSIWDEAYAHGWYDFEYQNGWLGGFEIHSVKVGDHLKISTGSEPYPFPVGVTFGGTGAGGSLTLASAAEQLNSSTDPSITNFYYRVMPSNYAESLTTVGPVDVVLTSFAATGGTGSVPPTAPPVCVPEPLMNIPILI